MTRAATTARTIGQRQRCAPLILALLFTAGLLHVVVGSGGAKAVDTTGAWTAASAMSEARGVDLINPDVGTHTATLLDGPICRISDVAARPAYCGQVLVAGGERSELYDPATRTWSDAGTDHGPVAAVLLDGPECRGAPSAPPQHCGKVLALGGFRHNAELYDPANGAWRVVRENAPGDSDDTPAPAQRLEWGSTATLLPSGKVLVIGRSAVVHNTAYSFIAEVYDPGADSWAPTRTPMVVPSGGTAVLLPTGQVLVVANPDDTALGLSGNQVCTLAHSAAGCAASPGKAIAQLYEPETGIWTLALPPPPGVGRPGSTATMLANGRVLFTGGGDTCADLEYPPPGCGSTATWLYDSAVQGAGAWLPTGAMNVPREYHTASLLPDGKVMVTGGRAGTFNALRPLDSSEVYDPTARGVDATGAVVMGAWVVSGPMITGRYGQRATTLDGPVCRDDATRVQCGTVLVTGGMVMPKGGGSAIDITGTDTVEVFDPAITASARPPSVASLSPSTGPSSGGSEVTITGAGLNGVIAVRFGDQAAPYWRVESSARMVATAPNHAAGTVAVVVETKAGGRSSAVDASRFSYFEMAGTSGAWNATGSLVGRRADHTATVLDGPPCRVASPTDRPAYCGKVLITGGVSEGNALNSNNSLGLLQSAELYDPVSATWKPVEQMTWDRASHTATLLADGRVLVTGGRGSGSHIVEIYDPATERWSDGGTLRYGRPGEHDAVLLDGPQCRAANPPPYCAKVLVVDSSQPEVYDPASGTSESTPFVESGATATLLDGPECHTAAPSPHCGKVLTAGRFNKKSYLYDPSAVANPPTGLPGQWRETGATKTDRSNGMTATRLADGRVLLAGGRNSSFAPLDSGELYDPSAEGIDSSGNRVTGKWTLTAPMVAGTTSHATTLLPNGTALVVDGCGATGSAGCERNTQISQLYAPAERTWAAGPVLVTPRRGHTATVLDAPSCRAGDRPSFCGKVLLSGGYDGEGRVLASAELLEPTARPSIAGLSPSAGPTTGTTVTISGGGLLGSDPKVLPQVRFGDAPATELLVRSDRAIVAVAPPHAPGDVTVTVERPGVPPSAPARFTYGTGAWAPTSSLDDCEAASGCVARVGHTATALRDGRVLVAGGQSPSGPLASAQIFDPVTTRWSAVGAMATARTGHTAVLLTTGKVLVAGGRNPTDGSATATAELYDPATGIWLATGPLATARSNHSATLLEGPSCRGGQSRPWCGKVLVAGGRPGRLREEVIPRNLRNLTSGLNVPLDSAELYDPITNLWVRADDLIGDDFQARYDHAATQLPSGQVLVAGGCTAMEASHCASVTDSVQLYEPDSGRWSTTDSLTGARANATATVLPGGRKVLLTGGCADFESMSEKPRCWSFPKSAEIYDAVAPSSKWTATGALQAPRAGLTATLMPDGKVLVAGSGVFQSQPAREAELYDPITGRFTRTDPLAVGRDGHTATLLADGRVLVAGGTGPGGLLRRMRDGSEFPPAAVDSAEIYTMAPEVTGVAPARATTAGGERVEITGANLQWAAAVTFGGVPATEVKIESPTKISVVTPAHPAGAVDLVVTSPGGVSLSEPQQRFTFVPTGVPGRVGDLAAAAVSDTAVRLTFTTAGTDGVFGPPATRYDVRFAETPIADVEAFAAAIPLCGGVCRFPAASLGKSIDFTVGGLVPGTTYHFALRALGDDGTPGPLSNPASAITSGTRTAVGAATTCPEVPGPGLGQVRYPSGYSMVGLPEGGVIGANSSLYSWTDQGARGAYSVHNSAEAVEAGRGYWAWFSCPRLLDITGASRDSLSLPLGAYHASMVANPSADGPVTATGFDFAARWDPTLENGTGGYRISGYRETQTLAVGEAVWVFSYRPTTIELRR